MKVNVYKTIDVEVSLEDCINEMLGMAEEKCLPTRKLQALDGATKVLEKITPEMVSKTLDNNPGALHIIRHRIQKWMNAIQEERDG